MSATNILFYLITSFTFIGDGVDWVIHGIQVRGANFTFRILHRRLTHGELLCVCRGLTSFAAQMKKFVSLLSIFTLDRVRFSETHSGSGSQNNLYEYSLSSYRTWFAFVLICSLIDEFMVWKGATWLNFRWNWYAIHFSVIWWHYGIVFMGIKTIGWLGEYKYMFQLHIKRQRLI